VAGKPCERAGVLDRVEAEIAEAARRRAGRSPRQRNVDQISIGKAARHRLPRSAQGRWSPAADRANPIDLLERQGRDRLPELLPIRYGRMLASPLAFFRGAAIVMAADLAAQPTTGTRVQLCGDAHLLNFGLFATPERRLVFDLNDFDETLAGPWEWDLKRLVASLYLAARERGCSSRRCHETALSAARGYQQLLWQLVGLGYLDVWYARLGAALTMSTLAAQARRTARRLAVRATLRDRLQAQRALTEVVDGRTRFAERPPTLTHLNEADADRVRRLLDGIAGGLPDDRRRLLARYRVVDLARKVVGIGSVGTDSFVALLHGTDAGDPLVLQLKETGPSALECALGSRRSRGHAARVVEGQRLMQAASDAFLSWTEDGEGRAYYCRQLRDWKGGVDLAKTSTAELELYGWLCGAVLALAHGRSGEPGQIAGYLGRSDAFAEAAARFGEAYAEQSERDHAALVAAVRSERLSAERDV
jgi:uncharacterized protein (DUF2252 family)